MSDIFVNDKLTMASTQSDKTLKRLEVFLRPTEKNEFFRFRLLWFKHEGSNRKVPYIERWIHQVWEDGENGKRQVQDIICPISKHVAENWPGNPYDDCPICNFANMNFVAFKDSAWKDKVAQNNSKTFKRKYDLVIPVYIVSDPCYSGNVGKIRVFRINDSKVGEKFKKLIVEKSAETQIFNGGKAVDFLIRMDKVKYDRDDGTFWTKNEIVQMGFSTKPYEINAITPDLINAFPFDDYFGAVPTMSDLKEFHKKYCLHATTDDIDFDGMNDIADTAPAVEQPEMIDEVPSDDEIDTVADFDEEGLTNGIDETSDNPFAEIPEELRGEDVDADELFSETKPSKNKAETMSESEIDSLLERVGMKK